uniref:Uncharacterized protein n=1 Tax=Ditylum brightwellii TaxID=49249 RepID=A0A7S4R662_9STRA|mmetsp:Transcript_8902/g.11938  ORF Transcript_8902/g.11938 Transcript_8902/m.11938 type:complete len:119 (-) Transcript_8902:398-754(-)
MKSGKKSRMKPIHVLKLSEIGFAFEVMPNKKNRKSETKQDNLQPPNDTKKPDDGCLDSSGHAVLTLNGFASFVMTGCRRASSLALSLSTLAGCASSSALNGTTCNQKGKCYPINAQPP